MSYGQVYKCEMLAQFRHNPITTWAASDSMKALIGISVVFSDEVGFAVVLEVDTRLKQE